MRNQGPVDTKDKSIETQRDSVENICFSIRSNRKISGLQPFLFCLLEAYRFSAVSFNQLQITLLLECTSFYRILIR